MKKLPLLFCVTVTALSSIVPILRAGCHLEVNYNEGWNVYNAERVAHGQQLYPGASGWTSVNYPMLSFALLAKLHGVTGDYLFTGRIVSILSLLAAAVLVSMLLRSLGVGRRASILAGMFCWACFCSLADHYVGMDDPQLLAQAVFLGALLTYVRHRRSLVGIAAAAMLFVVAMCIKHNPVDIPTAVFLDLLLTSALLTGWFAVWGLLFLGVAVWANVHFGGPFFVAQMLTPRRYLPMKIPYQFLNLLGPVLVPLVLGVVTGIRQWARPGRRIALLLMTTAIIIGGYFSGGSGVASNALFTSLTALAVLLGLFLDEPTMGGTLRLPSRVLEWAPAFCFAWLLIPLGVSGDWNLLARWREMSAEQTRFESDVAFLRSHAGPALCESLLECHESGKSYIYDPFNATRLLWFHKLDPRKVTGELHSGRITVVQTDAPLERGYEVQEERFAPEMQRAIAEAYVRVPRQSAKNGSSDDADQAGPETAMYVYRSGGEKSK